MPVRAKSTPRAAPEPRPPAAPLDRALADAVAARVGAARYGLWFADHVRFVRLGREVVVATRTDGSRDWLEGTFGEAVRTAATEVCGSPTPVKWVVDAELFGEPTARDPKASTAADPTPAPKAPPATAAQTDLFGDPVPPPKPKPRRPDPEAVAFERPSVSRGRRWKSLAEFVVGTSNRVAFAAAVSVVEEPGQAANPLVLHGPVGTGKTHLLEGIFAGLKRLPDARPVYVTAEEFTSRFVQASRLGKMSAFRRQFRDCSALLLDNLNFLANKRGSLEEFLHTFDALVSDGRQVVVTTDCHPRLADELMPELVDRLLGGAVWGLMPPDSDTRLDILRKKAGHAQPAIPDPVLTYLGKSLCGNVRELEGAVNSVRHYSRVTGRPVDQAVAREALGDLLRHAVRVVTVGDVDAAVCATLRMPAGTLQAKGRAWAVSHPRMVAIFLCRKHTAATYGEIGKHFGAKTHSTAVAAEKKVRGWLEKDASVAIGDRDWKAKELVERVERQLQR